MKNWKKIGFVLIVFITFCTTKVRANQVNDVVIIRVMETYGSALTRPQMVVIEPSGSTSVTKLLHYRRSNYTEVIEKNSILIQKEIQKWINEGYKISSSSTDSNQSVSNIFIIMTR